MLIKFFLLDKFDRQARQRCNFFFLLKVKKKLHSCLACCRLIKEKKIDENKMKGNVQFETQKLCIKTKIPALAGIQILIVCTLPLSSIRFLAWLKEAVGKMAPFLQFWITFYHFSLRLYQQLFLILQPRITMRSLEFSKCTGWAKKTNFCVFW